jgi:hypothetical protein
MQFLGIAVIGNQIPNNDGTLDRNLEGPRYVMQRAEAFFVGKSQSVSKLERPQCAVLAP